MKTVIRYSLLFWLIFYALIAIILSSIGEMEAILIHTASFVAPLVIIFYIHLLILLPSYFEKGRKRAYFLNLFLLVGIFTTAFGFFAVYLDKTIPLNIEHHQGRLELFVFFGRFMSFVPPIIIGALIRKSILLQQKTKESFELENKMLEAETNALKAQINPHFLFNTLNNIYSLSQFDNKKTGEAILQLSDILRYVTYDGNEKRVALSAELAHIASFIKLQLLRDEDDSNIFVEIDVKDQNLKISPLLLIPFIENAFKHSNHHDKQNGWIKINIKNAGTELALHVSNSVNDFHINSEKDEIGGVGMENVKRRLSLLYPKKHDLVLRMDHTTYAANLKINLSE